MSSSHDLYRIDIFSPVGRAEIRELLGKLEVRSAVVEWMVETLADLTSVISWQDEDKIAFIDSNAELEDKIFTLEDQIQKFHTSLKKLYDELNG